MGAQLIFDFNPNADIKKWVIVDDVVMGGRSSGSFRLNPDSHGVFEGSISLDNNGGFSMVKYSFERTPVLNYTKIVLYIKGDGKRYQFRIKSTTQDYYAYITFFTTSRDWQEIEIPLKDMYPSFRGRRLDIPNFSKPYIEEVGFLIGNKKNERFKLLIDKIELR
ncbi:CIA30 family protein [Aestuariivivens sediminicola]|uniref:CIA30 family protein n=1 Tax=Aestuariivivens sediminicola TaxID=2913560 RepID=UPI001F594D34|nr:CIA30 family protein [Aestuariivivens sediminicola]